MTPYLGYETYSVFYFSFYYPRDTFGTHLAYLSGVKFKLHTGWKSGGVSFFQVHHVSVRHCVTACKQFTTNAVLRHIQDE